MKQDSKPIKHLTEFILVTMHLASVVVFLGFLRYIVTFSAPKAFTITDENNVLSIQVKRVELLRHSASSPLIYVGKVRTSFHEHHGNWKIEEQLEEKIGLEMYEVEPLKETTKITFWNPSGPKVVIELATHDFTPLIIRWVVFPSGYDRTWIRLPADKDEHVYGAGEQYTRFNLRGYNYPVWTREQGVGRNKSNPVTFLTDSIASAGGDYHTSYFPLPTFVSSRRYYCHISGSNYIDLDFKNPNYHEISIAGPPESIFMNVDMEFEPLLRSMSFFLWRQPQLPRWVHTGAILGVQGGTKRILEHYEAAKNAGVKVSGLWIQDWSGNIHTNFGKRVYWDWVWNQEHYPGLDKEIRRLKEEGVYVLGYVTPNLNSKGTLFKEADKKGYFLKDKDGKTHLQDFMEFDCGTIDLTNPEAYNWYKGVIRRNMIDLGFGGWMADFSEYTPVDVVYHNGANPEMMHNLFPVLWARLNREAVREANKLGEIMFFMRAGGTGSQKFTTMTWAGDQNVDWSYSDGLPSVIPAALSLGMSGIGLTHFDIGLYTTFVIEAKDQPDKSTVNMTRSEELFLRSAELAVFTAVMRTHEGNQPKRNWQLDSSPDTLKHFATLTRIYRYLSTYRAAVEREQFRGGIPMQRPLFLHYQDDPVTFTLEYQYMFGRDLMVAPVIQPGATTWKLYLPSDTWEHLFDGEVFQGPGWITVDAPIGRPPVFVRRESKWRDYLVEVRHPDHLEFEPIPDPDLEGHCDITGGCI